MRRTSYYSDLYRNPYIKLKWFLPMIKRAVRTGERLTTKEPLPLPGYGYTIYYKPLLTINEVGSITLSLEWRDEEEEYRQTINIVKEESNLVAGSYVYYFLSPHGFKSRVLFYIGNMFRSRRTFYHLYENQKKSKYWRAVSYLSMEQPYKRYGKEYYREQLTPYGRRCRRYEEQQETGLGALANYVLDIGNKSRKRKKQKQC